MKNVYTCDPINKTAALVTNQSGCASDGTLSDEQLRENLVNKWKFLQEKLLTLPKKSNERKVLGLEIQETQVEINKLRPAKKARGVEGYFIDIAKEELTKPQFDIFMNKAVERLNDAKAT